MPDAILSQFACQATRCSDSAVAPDYRMNSQSAKCISSARARAIPGCSRCAAPSAFARPTSSLFDYLASPAVARRRAADAELVCLGRHGHGRIMSQAEINDAMIRHARAGRTVVRLKGGDPTIFARLAEELAALESAGVPYEIVPGVTAAQAASSHAGIPLTQRDDASCVAFVTGQESRDKQPALDYAALAKFPGHARVLHGRHDRARVEPRAHRSRQSRRHAGRHRPAMLVARSGDDVHDARRTGRRRAKPTSCGRPP